MMHTKYKSWALTSALAAFALAIASAPSFAQTAYTQDTTTEITVVGPHAHHRVVGRSTSGAPIEEVALTQNVSYADLDLRQPSAVSELWRRVEQTAYMNCQELDNRSLGNPVLDTDRSCTASAVGEAQAQVQNAVAYANR